MCMCEYACLCPKGLCGFTGVDVYQIGALASESLPEEGKGRKEFDRDNVYCLK